MSNLNYVPSWLDSAMTLLEKLNKCIEKIETIVNTVVSVTKTANDALSLAKTNEADIALNEADITALQNNKANATDITALQADITALQNEKSEKLYLHNIVFNTGSYQFRFWSITEESKKYSDKIKNGETFFTTLQPFNCILIKAGSVSVSKSLTLQLSEISLDNVPHSNGSITFAAYLDNSNQIVTITDYPEWYSASIVSEIVTEL